MPMQAPPDEIKHIATYLQRAQELKAHEPVVAYYCNYYAVKLALDRGSVSKESQTFLIALMDAIEQDKKQLAGHEAITSDVVGYAHIENFALRIFVNADNEDRAGRASKRTAKTFLASAIFLELLKTFGDLDAEVQEKIKYAKFKAADIIKALKEGKTPAPGPPGTITDAPGDDGDEQAYHHNASGLNASMQGASAAHSPVIASMPVQVVHSQQFVNQVQTNIHESSEPFDEHRHTQLMQAQKHAKFAVSALQYEDIPTAVLQLEQALVVLHRLRNAE